MGLAVSYAWAPFTSHGAGFYCWSIKSFVDGYFTGVAASHMSCQTLSPDTAAFIPAGAYDGPIVGVEFISDTEVVILQHHIHEKKREPLTKRKRQPLLKIDSGSRSRCIPWSQRVFRDLPQNVYSLSLLTPQN